MSMVVESSLRLFLISARVVRARAWSLMIKKAVFMEGHVPKGGACISAFLVLTGKGGILVGKMTKPEIWVERFFVGEKFAPQYASSGKWLLPASHLKYGEKPDDAAKRILTEQVEANDVQLAFSHVQSHLSQDPNDPESAHWDICFIYKGTVKGELKRPEWFSELRFVKANEMTSDDFTRGHGDVLKEFGMIH
jgi:ADP-ribose pyrophosphatase YjhB (NUDIX family)